MPPQVDLRVRGGHARRGAEPAWQALLASERGDLRSGGNGRLIGVRRLRRRGSFAVQFAAHRGRARGGHRQRRAILDYVAELGAERALDYRAAGDPGD
ncbi:MAG: hypothetical protein U5K56_18020 [Halioglobus sp.]|nr:hypothetical protein [Halioglobus sp.]